MLVRPRLSEMRPLKVRATLVPANEEHRVWVIGRLGVILCIPPRVLELTSLFLWLKLAVTTMSLDPPVRPPSEWTSLPLVGSPTMGV